MMAKRNEPRTLDELRRLVARDVENAWCKYGEQALAHAAATNPAGFVSVVLCLLQAAREDGR
jgi:hypothetical protein